MSDPHQSLGVVSHQSLSGVPLPTVDPFASVPPISDQYAGMVSVGGLANPTAHKAMGSRVNLKVAFLTSGQFTTMAAALHFFQVEEGRERAQRLRRLVVVVDKETFAADHTTQMQRCGLVSKIEEIGIFQEHLRPLSGPMTRYDDLLNATTPLDFIRYITCIFSTRDPAHLVSMYELEEGQPLSVSVNCRPAVLTDDDGVVKKMQHDEVVKRLRDSHQHEVARLREMLQKQKDGQLMELLDAKTQIEQLRHSLSLADAAASTQYPKLPYQHVNDTSVAPPLPKEPPPIPQAPISPSPHTPQVTHVAYPTGGTTPLHSEQRHRNKAGELVDKLTAELEANSRFLESFPVQRPGAKEVSPPRDYGGGGGGAPYGTYRVTPRGRGSGAFGGTPNPGAHGRGADLGYGQRPSIPRFPGYPGVTLQPGAGRSEW